MAHPMFLLTCYILGFIASVLLAISFLEYDKGLDKWTRTIIAIEISLFWPLAFIAMISIILFNILWDLADWLWWKTYVLGIKIIRRFKK